MILSKSVGLGIHSPEHSQHGHPFRLLEPELVTVAHGSRCDQDRRPTECEPNIGMRVGLRELVLSRDDLREEMTVSFHEELPGQPRLYARDKG